MLEIPSSHYLGTVTLLAVFSLLLLAGLLRPLRRRPPWVEVILTGRQAPPELIDLADLVTEMQPLKHYYTTGTPARRGIEW